jgi:hypothetical protein
MLFLLSERKVCLTESEQPESRKREFWFRTSRWHFR